MIWGFWGSGKSSVRSVDVKDVDSKLFEFMNVDETLLHNNDSHMVAYHNPEYPENYIDFVKKCDEDIVLINCHLNLLSSFENVEIVYPAKTLKEEYLQRYRNRGDHESFISYMSEMFDQIIDEIERLPYKKYCIKQENIYISDILNEKGDVLMTEFMTKSNLVTLIEDSKKLNVFPKSIYESSVPDANEVAMDLFNEKIEIDLKQLQEDVEVAKRTYGKEYLGFYAQQKDNDVSVIKVAQYKDAIWVVEKYVEEENRNYGFPLYEKEEKFKQMLQDGYQKTTEYHQVGHIHLNDLEGYSSEEAQDIIMDAIAAGVIVARHGQIYPYTYGYELVYKDMHFKPGGNLFEMSENVVKNMRNNVVEKEVFGPRRYAYSDLSLNQLKKETEEKIKIQPKNIIPDNQTEYYRHRMSKPHWERGHIATMQDLDEAKSVNAIIAGLYGGNYSSMTTNGQNELMRVLVALRGDCLDYLHEVKEFPYRGEIIDFYKKKGIDIETEKGINDWIKANPGRCAFEKNRQPQLDDVIKQKTEQRDVINQGKDKEKDSDELAK